MTVVTKDELAKFNPLHLPPVKEGKTAFVPKFPTGGRGGEVRKKKIYLRKRGVGELRVTNKTQGC